jgi:hypothetical protein
MGKIRLYSTGWWLLHVAALALTFWLGHAVHFVLK